MQVTNPPHPQASQRRQGPAVDANAWNHSETPDEPPHKVWSAEEVRQLQTSAPAISLGKVLKWQMGVSLAVLIAAWLWASAGTNLVRDTSVVASALWGSACAVIPSALMAWGLRKPATGAGMAGLVLTRLFAWELVKIVTSVALLALSPLVVAKLNWLVLILAFVLVTKASFGVLLSSLRSSGRSTARSPLG